MSTRNTKSKPKPKPRKHPGRTGTSEQDLALYQSDGYQRVCRIHRKIEELRHELCIFDAETHGDDCPCGLCENPDAPGGEMLKKDFAALEWAARIVDGFLEHNLIEPHDLKRILIEDGLLPPQEPKPAPAPKPEPPSELLRLHRSVLYLRKNEERLEKIRLSVGAIAQVMTQDLDALGWPFAKVEPEHLPPEPKSPIESAAVEMGAVEPSEPVIHTDAAMVA